MAPPAQDTPDPAKGLPPVVAPSGRFIAQLFLVPGLIVAGAVAVLLGFTWLAGTGGLAGKKQYLENLRSSNADIRWRTASDLAQVLRRDEQLAADVDFGLSLTDLCRQALADLKRYETDIAAEPPGGPDGKAAERMTKARQQFRSQRSFVQYLGNCLGHLRTPVGGGVLAEIARDPGVHDPKSAALLRRQAVWSLAALGHNLQEVRRAQADRQAAVLEQLDQSAAGEARRAADFLRGRGRSAEIEALLDCADADDPFLRKLSAHALTFWNGQPAEERRIEEALVRLARDDGHGTAIVVTEKD
jgi:hypothetical protein